jgi:hypothetical protein
MASHTEFYFTFYKFACNFLPYYPYDTRWTRPFLRSKLNNREKPSPSSEAKSRPAIREFYKILRNPKLHYHFYKSLPPVSILSHIKPVHKAPPYFNIILPPASKSP